MHLIDVGDSGHWGGASIECSDELAAELMPVGAHTLDDTAHAVCFGRTRHSLAATPIDASPVVGAADVKLPSADERYGRCSLAFSATGRCNKERQDNCCTPHIGL